MIAILHDNGNYIGYKVIEQEGEEQTFELDYFLVDEVPEEILNRPENSVVTLSEVEGELVVNVEAIPIPTPEIDEITQLKLTIAEMAEAYETEATILQLAIVELAEIVDSILAGGAE